MKGSFDKYAESSKTKKGTAEVDAAFLKEIGGWREMLALYKQFADAKTLHDKTAIQPQIDATDRQINNLVYELYGLIRKNITVESAVRCS